MLLEHVELALEGVEGVVVEEFVVLELSLEICQSLEVLGLVILLLVHGRCSVCMLSMDDPPLH